MDKEDCRNCIFLHKKKVWGICLFGSVNSCVKDDLDVFVKYL